MNRSDLTRCTILEVSRGLVSKEISSLDLVDACLKNIEKDPEANAFLEVFGDVREQAKQADKRRAQGEKGELLGIPIAVKDNILIEGRIASSASRILEKYIASYDSTVIRKLKEAGAIFIGRTNMDEFAMGSSTEFSAFGVTRNPKDPSRVAGGSSGGSAASVAAGMSFGALGSDTGGSVREPASFCGVVGLKPTYGMVSRSGLMAMGSSLDQIGPLGKDVTDAELIFNTIRGRDQLDSTSIDESTYPRPIRKKKIGVARHLLTKGIDADVLERFEETLKRFQELGYELIDVELPSAGLALAVYYILMPAEASTNLARFDGVRYGLSLKGASLLQDYSNTRGKGFGPEVRRRIILGTYVLSSGYYDAYYGKATTARRILTEEIRQALDRVDVIASPTVPSPAFKIGEKSDPLSMYLADIFTVTANLTGNPAISIPMGTVRRDGSELPVGLHLTAAHGAEALMFQTAKDIESL